VIEGKTDVALETLALADRLADGSSQAAAALGNTLARKGQPERARTVLQRLLGSTKQNQVRSNQPPELTASGVASSASTVVA
jgi:hypothetical protein